ncbi:L-seryl-tRNA(Sec) selenium transferase [Sutcliffiella horikoshii]|uniref:L-seryl-tRNA(Sec) selenium transferase n=1 Tax=Sutcliffiella horikoshii TaxID=79883 RepID=A0A5D4T6V2_9BACI|nr:L-seryl-tRNA(Sec) selenium transferase [Sutcliffiella horikoshii]TYS70438.1 L-seryl-tRNA(Sec) selenium transferase [Sutcliffiella horikoshii]
MKDILRNIPPVHELKNQHTFVLLGKKYNLDETVLTSVIRQALELVRNKVKNGLHIDKDLTRVIWDEIEEILKTKSKPSLHSVINATGTILHTNLGRARLSREAINRVVEVAENYSNLEYDIDSGKRGSRHDLVEELIKEVTGAEAAIVVNNNAAAVFLILNAFGKGKEVIVSRGQLVEIGGSFRISSIMEESGAKLIEVGTTNKTHLKDYEQALSDETAMVLKVHTSNFKIIGFTQSVSTEDLVGLKQSQADLIVYEDLGSGVLFDFSAKGIGEEPVVKKVVQTGVDLVSFSGDKLLGGPQVGIIAGKKELIDQLKRHQLARVLRVDKMSFAALEATMQAYANNKAESIPTVRDMLLTPEEVHEKAMIFLDTVRELDLFKWDIYNVVSMVGGGTMPDVTLPSIAVKVNAAALSAQALADELRKGSPSVVVRVQDQQVILDFRTITQGEIPKLAKAFREIELTYRG